MYRGPSDPGLRQAWITARRRVIREHHPDLGGSAEEFSRRLAELDAEFIRREQPTGLGADGGPVHDILWAAPPVWQPARRLLTKGRRTAGRRLRQARGRIPAGLPGAKRYVDL